MAMCGFRCWCVILCEYKNHTTIQQLDPLSPATLIGFMNNSGKVRCIKREKAALPAHAN
jgi:hypothetical protein